MFLDWGLVITNFPGGGFCKEPLRGTKVLFLWAGGWIEIFFTHLKVQTHYLRSYYNTHDRYGKSVHYGSFAFSIKGSTSTPVLFRREFPSPPRTILRHVDFPLMVKAIQGLTVNRGWRQDSHPLPFEMFNQLHHGDAHFQIRRRHAQ